MIETLLEASPRYPSWAATLQTPIAVSPFVLAWPAKADEWVYVDTFSKSITLAPSPKEMSSLNRDSQVILMNQRVLLPERLDPLAEVIAYVNHLRKTVLYLEIANTHRCDLNCTFCYRHADGVDHSATMSSDTISRLQGWLESKLDTSQYRFLEVDILGGDPLMALDSLFELLRRIKGLGQRHDVKLEASLITNGTRLKRSCRS